MTKKQIKIFNKTGKTHLCIVCERKSNHIKNYFFYDYLYRYKTLTINQKISLKYEIKQSLWKFSPKLFAPKLSDENDVIDRKFIHQYIVRLWEQCVNDLPF